MKKIQNSIRAKLLIVTILSMTVFASAFSLYIYRSMRSNAINRYLNEASVKTDFLSDQLERYLNSCMMSVNSFYTNKDLANYVTTGHSSLSQEEAASQLFDFLLSLHYANSEIQQFYLAMPATQSSLRFVPENLSFIIGPLSENVTLPHSEHFLDAVLGSSHPILSYDLPVHNLNEAFRSQTVFTLWVPLAHLPANQTPSAYLAIDFPSSYLYNNCLSLSEVGSDFCLVNESNQLLVSSDSTENQDFFSFFAKEAGDTDDTMAIRNNLLYICKPITMGRFTWKLLQVIPINSTYRLTLIQTTLLLVFLGIGTFLLIIVNSSSIMFYTKPLRQIRDYMKHHSNTSWSEADSLAEYVHYPWKDEIGTLIQSFDSMAEKISDHTNRQHTMELLYARSELRTLQAQINPHFIYNIVQCFATNFLRDQNIRQYRLLSSFGQMLHYAMVLEPSVVPLSQEIDYVNRYIDLQSMRFDDTLSAEWDITVDPEKVQIPKMSIQPLVENSISHGDLFRGQPKGRLIIRLLEENGHLSLIVADNGTPITPEKRMLLYCRIEAFKQHLSLAIQENRAESPSTSRQSIAIQNVYARLLLTFGSCEFSIDSNDIGGTTVSFQVPIS